ncbi:Peptidase S10, serine carboxypeptidase [Cinnamomum micranthum f. kanehirae]|uniref:Peptidase S10, serine carboxypeptidase n=1 Tax=Cinnamomum micranthum f. kanehirae TaxID=337451 RepID=A0A443NL23_9MAGN|nr:Peptidase S10, serine carboxypeptidase [Cinnamomum micranthum f. kanehirae]
MNLPCPSYIYTALSLSLSESLTMAWYRWVIIFVASSFFSKSSAELITALPSQPSNIPFKQYSGYITTDTLHGRALFYYFVEANVADPLSRPLTLWLNGGPGCSSLGAGAFMEHGPFRVGDNELLIQNPYSWNLESNMLYVESPIGVGFSYSNASEDYINWNDTRTGHYIPQLAALILEHNKNTNIEPIKLKAIALGNPLLDLDISVNSGDYMWAHGVISDKTWMLQKTICNVPRYWAEQLHDKVSQECIDVFNRVKDEIGPDTDEFDLLSLRCLSPTAAQKSISTGTLARIHTKLARRTNGDPCLSGRISAYLNKPKVQKALHANTTGLPYLWDFCKGPLKYQNQNIEINLIPLVAYLLQEGIPVMLFSGDQDTRIPLTQTRIIGNMLAQQLKFTTFTPYAPWYNKKQVGGWAQSFGKLREGKNVTYLTYATVRGGAHQVPFTSPSQALTLLLTMACCLWVINLLAISFLSKSWAELITALPSQPSNIPFKQYSGYITTDTLHARALFYYFVEANVADPLSRPLTLWLTGGPGCSSLGAAFMEHGPFRVGDNGLLIQNPYSWNLESNMLYVESPIGVGFSYSNASEDYINWNDTRTGHYIPQLAALILEHNKNTNIEPIKLKAIALGNPLLDLDISVNSGDYMWAHGVISDKTWMLQKTICNVSRYWAEQLHDKVSQECIDVFNRVKNEIGPDTDEFDLLSLRCLSPTAAQKSICTGTLARIHTKLARRTNGDPCLSGRISAYLNKPKVQKALHANTTGLPYLWDFCKGPLKYQNQNIEINLIPLVAYLLQEGIPFMLFSGDQDTRIPLTQTRIIGNMLAQQLKFTTFTPYAPWYNKKQVGGWAQSFGKLREGKNVTFLTYATVRGGAHQVPFTSPSQALTLFKAFLSGSPLPKN